MREVKAHDWPAFCDRINGNERGGTISIHKVEPTDAKVEIVRHAQFESVNHGRRDDCSDRIAVRFSGAAEYEIIEPIRIQLTETDGRAAFQSVVVEAENGVTILTFSSRAARGMVERTGFAVMKLGRFAGAKGVFTALRDGPMGLA